MTTDGPYCDCSRPFPAMTRLHAGGPHRYYLCQECGAVRAEILRSGRDRGIARVEWYTLQSNNLPNPVQNEAQAILDTPTGKQLTLL
jgi:hypothetical protein